MKSEIDLSGIPDSIAPIVAWRTWKLTKSGYLQSPVTSDAIWEPRKPFEARCLCGIYSAREPRQHTCGIYSTKSAPLNIVRNYINGIEGTIMGQVNIWGKVTVHQDGYRSQFAYPTHLYFAMPRIPLQLIEMVGAMRKTAEMYVVDGDVVTGYSERQIEASIPVWSRENGLIIEGVHAVAEMRVRWYENRGKITVPLEVGRKVHVPGAVGVVKEIRCGEIALLVKGREEWTYRKEEVKWNDKYAAWQADRGPGWIRRVK